ncbi:autophagy-related protein 27 [Dimargaris cristalligena]|uniref:Autophagy-related protein 27 n=1 Tax=Dimargaris cristalligena TaxID=215637 RepID=A0A4P9ZTQ5_9FUNG|nr:autophagy-related protein 27 [Dimargaris cristalligena]|eukprot:RKP36875.1 autophagy-related protein 27 [Dimargaris cristalligena]
MHLALNCKDFTLGDQHYDFSALDREHVVEIKTVTPPTHTIDRYTINPCQALQAPKDVPEIDRCPDGTFVCKTSTNYKPDEKDRVIAVQAIGGSKDETPVITAPRASSEKEDLLWSVKGPTVDKTDYRCDVRLFCDKDVDAAKAEPKFVSMTNGILTLEWTSAAVCVQKRTDPEDPKKPEDKPSDDPEKNDPEPSSGGGGFFSTLFKIIGILLLVYFVVGAVYNYAVAGASGLDLIPHRYFWQELPYLCLEFVQFAYNSCSGRRRGGYSAV